MTQIQVYNEIGRLRKAILHRPGHETRNYPEGQFSQIFTLRPSSNSFDLAKALDEHRNYAEMLEREGVEIAYLDQLLVEALAVSPNIRATFIDSFVAECGATGEELQAAIRSQLDRASSPADLAKTAIEGIRYGEAFHDEPDNDRLAVFSGEAYAAEALLVNPLNTMWFTRDPASAIGNGITLNHMYWPERNRETLLYKTIIEHHPMFADTPIFYRHESSFHLEGGDLINLNRNNIAVGISQRTESAAIDTLARQLLWNPQSDIDAVWAIKVPDEDLCIHLDTYLSRVDYESFVIDRHLLNETNVYCLSRGRKEGACRIRAVEGGVKEALSAALGTATIDFIPCGGLNSRSADSERANNAASVLCLKPGKVCVYAENVDTNRALEQAGIELVPISIFELTSGFGGPNCLCLPIQRDE